MKKEKNKSSNFSDLATGVGNSTTQGVIVRVPCIFVKHGYLLEDACNFFFFVNHARV